MTGTTAKAHLIDLLLDTLLWLLRIIHLSTTADQKDYEDASCRSQRTIRAPTQHSLPWNLIFPHRKAVFL